MERKYIIIIVVCLIWILSQFTIKLVKRALNKKGKSKSTITMVELLLDFAILLMLYIIAAWMGFDIAD